MLGRRESKEIGRKVVVREWGVFLRRGVRKAFFEKMTYEERTQGTLE